MRIKRQNTLDIALEYWALYPMMLHHSVTMKLFHVLTLLRRLILLVINFLSTLEALQYQAVNVINSPNSRSERLGVVPG